MNNASEQLKDDSAFPLKAGHHKGRFSWTTLFLTVLVVIVGLFSLVYYQQGEEADQKLASLRQSCMDRLSYIAPLPTRTDAEKAVEQQREEAAKTSAEKQCNTVYNYQSGREYLADKENLPGKIRTFCSQRTEDLQERNSELSVDPLYYMVFGKPPTFDFDKTYQDCLRNFDY